MCLRRRPLKVQHDSKCKVCGIIRYFQTTAHEGGNILRLVVEREVPNFQGYVEDTWVSK